MSNRKEYPALYSSIRSLAGWAKAIGRGCLFRLVFPIRLKWGGWWLPSNDVLSSQLYCRTGFEESEQQFLLRFLEPGMVVLDIGAHQGLYSILAAKKVGVSGRVFSFEPSPREFRRLRWNLSINRCRNVVAVRSAIGKAEGTAGLFVCQGRETGCNSLRMPAVTDRVIEIHVPLTTIDRHLEEAKAGRVDLVKIDIEGAELDMLQGGTALINYHRPFFLCELADVRTEPWGYRAVDIYDFLVARDFRWFSIVGDGRLRPCSRKSHYHENLVAAPVEKLALIAEFIEEAS